MCAARNPSPWLFCGECTLYSSSRFGPELDRKFYCGMCHHGALLSPQIKLQLTIHPPFAPLRLMFSKGNSSWSVVILTRWMWSSTRCKRAPASGQTVTSRGQSKLSWGAGSGAATLMCQIEIRHAFCFLLDYWNIWAQIILHTAARILCRLIIHWVALLFLQRIRADWVLWQNRMTRWLLCPGNQFENLSTFFFFEVINFSNLIFHHKLCSALL